MATLEVLGVDEVSIDEEVKDLKDEVLENQDEAELKKDGKKEEKKEEKKETEENKPNSKEKSPIAVHGLIQVGKVVIPDYADVASENAAALVVVDASHEKTGLGVSVIRIDDFNKSPDNPISKATVINPHWDKTFGKASVSVNSEFAFLDKMPEGNGITSKIAGTYDFGKGWNFEGAHFHGFNKGTDSDAFRASITKKINDALSLTAQGRYKSDYDKKFFGRVIMDVNLGNGFGAQMSCIAKDGKLIPTMCVVYNF